MECRQSIKRGYAEWLTGFNETGLQKHIEDKVTFEQFFQLATLNPNAHLITGVICGHRIEEIENPLTQQVRYLDKLVDELAKGRKIEKILRVGQERSIIATRNDVSERIATNS